MDSPNAPMPMTQEKKPMGPVIGLIVIIALILLGGIYFYSTRNESPTTSSGEQNTSQSTPEDTTMSQVESQSSSDDTNSIQADLDATNFNSLDSDFQELN